MSYLALAYPELARPDYEWIQNYRQKHDPRYFSVVQPHFTLIFSMGNIEQTEFVNEVKKQADGFSAFDFIINVATINQDDSGEYYHEFLVPDTGYSNIVKLHDRLYADKFADALRYDIDFIPHIGIGNSNDVKGSKQRIDELNNAQNISIAGKVSGIEVVSYDNGIIETVHKILF
jgi:hypothetical protein